MDIKEFAKMIDGFEYPARELYSSKLGLMNTAKENGFLVIYTQSDDLLEFGGIIDDEMGANNGVKKKVGTKGVNIEAVWCPEDKPETSFEIKVDCHHEKFNIMEDGHTYCIGAVIHKDDLNL